MKALVVLVVFIFVLAGAAGASIYFHIGPLDKMVGMPKKNEPPPPPPAPPVPVQKNVGSYSIPLFKRRQIVRQIGIDVAIAVRNASSTEVDRRMTELQNAFFTELYLFVPRLSDPVSDQGKSAMHDDLMKIAVKMFGSKAIDDVIIKGVYVRAQ